MATIEERVKSVTARILKLDPDQIKPEHSFTVDLGAESVQSIELVAMFEEEFGIEMDEDAALSVETVDKAVEFIAEVCRQQGVDPVRNSTKGPELEKGKISNGVDVEQ